VDNRYIHTLPIGKVKRQSALQCAWNKFDSQKHLLEWVNVIHIWYAPGKSALDSECMKSLKKQALSPSLISSGVLIVFLLLECLFIICFLLTNFGLLPLQCIMAVLSNIYPRESE